MFVVRKDSGIIPTVLTQILYSCVNGVTLSDPDLEDSPIVYANKAFENMTEYTPKRKSWDAIAASFRAPVTLHVNVRMRQFGRVAAAYLRIIFELSVLFT